MNLTPIWALEIQNSVDSGWRIVAEPFGLDRILPHLPAIGMFASALIMISLGLLVKPWVWSRQTQYRLTPEYLIIVQGVMARTQKQCAISSIKDLKLEQSFFDRLVGVGTIDVTSSDPNYTDLRIRGIASPGRVFQTLYRVWQDAMTRSSPKSA